MCGNVSADVPSQILGWGSSVYISMEIGRAGRMLTMTLVLSLNSALCRTNRCSSPLLCRLSAPTMAIVSLLPELSTASIFVWEPSLPLW